MSSITRQETYKWNCRLRSFLEGNSPRRAILGYAHMRKRGVWIDSYTLVFVIKACGFLMPMASEGEKVHGQAFKMGFESEIVTQTALLKMYGIFGDLVSAQRVFDETPERDMVQWNALLATYAQKGQPYKAIEVADDLIDGGVRPNEVTVVSIASACSQLKALAQGRVLHGYAIKNLIGFDTIVHNALIDLYARCGRLTDARRLFETMTGRNLISWTSMMNGYCDNNYPDDALALFRRMEVAGVTADEVTMLGVVAMCSKLGRSELADWVDKYVEKNGFANGTYMANALIDMHGKCGNIRRSCEIFGTMVSRTLVSWAAMIQGLAMHGFGVVALVRFSQMQREGFLPDEVIFLNVLNACSHAGLIAEGRQCFASMVQDYGLLPWMEHYGTMVDLLCRAGLVDDAFELVKSMPTMPDAAIWRMLFRACRDQGNMDLAREVAHHLLQMEPDHSGNYILKSNLHAMIREWDGVEEVRDDMENRGLAKRGPGCSLIEVNSL